MIACRATKMRRDMRGMMMVAAWLAAGLAAGCSSDQTAIVVEVWSDLDSPEQIDELAILLDTTPVAGRFALGKDVAGGRPRIIKRLSLVPQSQSTRTRVIEAAGLKDELRRVRLQQCRPHELQHGPVPLLHERVRRHPHLGA